MARSLLNRRFKTTSIKIDMYPFREGCSYLETSRSGGRFPDGTLIEVIEVGQHQRKNDFVKVREVETGKVVFVLVNDIKGRCVEQV